MFQFLIVYWPHEYVCIERFTGMYAKHDSKKDKLKNTFIRAGSKLPDSGKVLMCIIDQGVALF